MGRYVRKGRRKAGRIVICTSLIGHLASAIQQLAAGSQSYCISWLSSVAGRQHAIRIYRIGKSGTRSQFCFSRLGINKELDLQSALTEIRPCPRFARRVVRQTGKLFNCISLLLWHSSAAGAVIALIVGARRAPLPTWLALLGATFVIAFVVIRAASFHHIDRLIRSTIFGFRWNWILEMGGIVVVLLASRWRQHQTKSAGLGPYFSKRLCVISRCFITCPSRAIPCSKTFVPRRCAVLTARRRLGARI